MNNIRLLIITILMFLFFALLVIKLVDIQLIKADELSYFAKRQQTNTEVIKAERGYIFDRNNVLLVYNRNDISFYVDLRMLSPGSKSELAARFSKAFGKSRNHYLKLLKNSGKTICIEKRAPYETAKSLMDYKLPGLFYKEEPKRIYHYGSLASHILGYVNQDFIGVNGIDGFFDNELNGEDGARLVERDAMGKIISVPEEQTKNPVAGVDIYLTIDKNYQGILEDELKKAVEFYSAESAVGIIMDPNTGEILALANISDYDPNFYWSYNDFARKNRAITDVYEPGSTFKVFTLAALFDRDECIESELVDVENGNYKFRNAYIKDTKKFQWLSVKGIIEESSNIGIAKLIQRLNDEDFYGYVRAFGFGTYTSVTLPGEVTGKLYKPAGWSKLTKVFMSFGYGISVTPLQLTAAFCAAVNGGILYRPLIVKKIVDKTKNVVKEFIPVKTRNVISENTSERIRKLLTGAVENGTGSFAKLESVSAGGKTGTSKVVVNGKYSDDSYFSTFIGFFPADMPRLVCYVLLNKPEGDYYGGKVSAPVFKNIAERIIKEEPGKFINDKIQSGQKKPEQTVEYSGEKKFVNNINLKKPAITKFENNTIQVNNKNLMPDLRGKTVKEALLILSSLQLKYDLTGSGIVVKQSVEPGTPVYKNQYCKVYCAEDELTGTRIY